MISTKARYAIRMMIDLAENSTEGQPIALDKIATRQNISKKYLESIAKTLVGGGLLESASGKGGGYKLSRSPKSYNVYEILELTEESLATVACLKKDAKDCPSASKCQTVSMWKRYEDMTRDYFSSITIADLVNGKV